MPHDPLVQEALTQLDAMEREVTTWERGFLDSLLRQTYPIRPKQLAVLAEMADQYLPASGLGAELRGQQRLFG